MRMPQYIKQAVFPPLLLAGVLLIAIFGGLPELIGLLLISFVWSWDAAR